MLYDKKWDKAVEQPVQFEPWQKILLNAAKYIREHGWCQCAFYNSDGNVCAATAIHKVAGKDTFSARNKFAKYLSLNTSLPTTTFEIAGWNDAKGRTKEEVIAALEGAALLK